MIGRGKGWRLGILPVAWVMLAAVLSGCSGPYERIAVGEAAEAADAAEGESIVIPTQALPDEEKFVSEEGKEEGPEKKASSREAENGEKAGAGPERSDFVLLFGGDVLLSDHVLAAYDQAGGIDGVLDQGYEAEIAASGYFMVNQEFPFSNQGTPEEDKQYTFRLPPERVSVLKEMGVDGVTLANNHALDYGTDALLDTIQVLDQAGIAHTGAGTDLDQAMQPVDVDLGDGRTMAVIGVTRVIPQADWAAWKGHGGMFSTYDPALEDVLAQIRAQKARHDYVTVFVHWGVERSEQPEEYQRTLARKYVDAGADLVVGCHPHVLQGLEYYQGKPVVYSLGNFVFGSSIPRTALLEVTVPADPGAGLSLRLIPGTSGAGYTRRLTKAEELAEFWQYMERISRNVSFQEDGTAVPMEEK